MFKKMITLMMVVSIFTVNAYATSNAGLKAAFDELNFALTVEWDQKDQSFYSAQMKKFSGVVRELQAKGLTNAQLINFVKAEIKDEKISRDIQTALTMISIQKMSPAEAADYMSKTMKNAYAKGASWNGDATLLLLGVGVLAIVIAVALAGPVQGGGGYGCYDYYTCDTYCDYWGCYDDCYYTCY